MAQAMGCHDVKEVLMELLDGGLEAGPAAEAQAHLAGCARCAALREDLRVTLALVHMDVVPEPPAGTWERFGADVREEIRLAEEADPVGRPVVGEAPTPRPRSGLPRPTLGERLSELLGWTRFAPVYAATAAAVLLAVAIARNQPTPFVPERDLAMAQDIEVLRAVDRPDDLEMIERLPDLLKMARGA